MGKFYLIIDGEKKTAEKSFGVINPATESVFAQAPDCSRQLLNLAVESASQAFNSWKIDEAARRNALSACADVLRSSAEELAEIYTQEQGKTLRQSKEELYWSAWWIDEVLSLEIPVDLAFEDEIKRHEVHRKPLGVIGSIEAWNFPILLAIAKIAPALLVGNTMVVKPSPYTPLTTLRMGELFSEILPPGVLNIISGGDQLGAWMTSHPKIQKVTLTGSVATGIKVYQSVASNLRRVTLELGGNDAAIVLEDNDPKEIAGEIFTRAFAQNGQICFAIKRLYVHENIYSEMVDELKKLAESVVLGDGSDPKVNIGPINNLMQLNRVIELTEDARDHGAKILTGGKRLDRPGYFFPPTIVTNISDGIRLVDEEQFGPVLPVISFIDENEVIERANANDFGLGGSVWTRNLEHGIELAARLECGSAGVNQHVDFHPKVPFGGTKQSGLGIKNGIWGLDDLCQLQVISIKK